MMSEELDFEADTPVSDSSKQLHVAKCFPQVIKKEPVDDATETEYNNEITSGAVKVKYEATTAESYPVSAKIDAEKTVDTRETEKDSGGGKLNAVEEKSDGDIEYNTGSAKTDEMEEQKSDMKETDYGTEGVEIACEKKIDDGEVESDTGEILSDADELTNNEINKDKGDLEDGELDEDITVPNKAPDVVCRFYQRGTCLYGSQCRNSHVSNRVYNMFSPDPPKNNFMPFGLPNFFRPPLFHPNIVPMVPEVETPWERGIKRAKILVDKSRRLSEDLELENDWERCLEEAKANIKKASMKRKSFQDEKPYCEPKYCKKERFRERSPLQNEDSPKHKYSKNMHSKYDNESNYLKKTKPDDKESTHDPFKWVDPWQRSKSPKRRTRSISFSVSPSQSPRHSRERSVSSSSSSSLFENIYRGKDENQGIGERSTSRSASPVSKRNKDFKSQVYGKKRSYSRSVSRSISRSPKMGRYSRSSSSGHSGNLYTSKKVFNEKKHHEKTSKKFNSRSVKQYATNERTKDVPLSSSIKPSYSKTKKKFSSRSKSRSSSSLSSLSRTSLSSVSDTDMGLAFSRRKEDKVKKANVRTKDDKAKEPFKSNQAYQENRSSNSGTSRKHSEGNGDLEKRKYSPERPKLSIPAFTIKRSKSNLEKNISSQSALSNPSSKSIAPKKATVEKPSAESMELLRYHSLSQANNRVNSSKPVVKPPEPKTSLPRNDHKSSAEEMQLLRYHSAAQSNNSANPSKPVNKPPEPKTSLPVDQSTDVSKSTTKEVASSKTVSVVQPKSEPAGSNNSDKNTKKKVLSKRKMLLQQLQAIEDAIARKKQPAQ